MSVRHYSGPAPRRGPGWLGVLVTWLLAAAVVALQIAYPLVATHSQGRLAAATVVVFFLASLSHAWVHRGVLWAAGLVLVTTGIGFLVEVVGTRSGYPFGDYSYSDVLGLTVAGVPVVVALAWTMMAYPAYVVATTLSSSRFFAALVGGWVLMAWDVFLDPMMVKLGAWTWSDVGRELPGVSGVPLQNFAGWFAVGVVMTGLLVLLPRREVSVGQPAALFLWVYVSSVAAAAWLFDQGSVAVVGGIAMGLVAFPFAWRMWIERV